jgi:hypothetical protein
VTLKEIKPLLDQQPAIWKCFTDHFDISPDGGGLRLGGRHDRPFRGYRVGPYHFPVKLKGDAGDSSLQLIITTDVYYLDSERKEVLDEMKATYLEEVLVSISLAPINSPKREGTYIRAWDDAPSGVRQSRH